jgi:hypothetical protein
VEGRVGAMDKHAKRVSWKMTPWNPIVCCVLLQRLELLSTWRQGPPSFFIICEA